ncbi:MAG: hypothetical protein EAZ20_03185 [Bacteroidetes bacterium]|nr:MAG: hypothetical protein EAZ20_03185 [Bacteroidota bacterium]
MDKEQHYAYNRYLDYLHVKASDALTLRIEAEEKVRQNEKVVIAKNFISVGLDNETISKGTGLTIKQIEQLRKEK